MHNKHTKPQQWRKSSFHENPKPNDFISLESSEQSPPHCIEYEAPLQMVFPHIPFITPYTVVVFGSHHPVYFQLHRSCLLGWWLCGLEVLRGQWIWLLRLEAACRPCHRKWASPMGSVCHMSSNRPPGNLLVPTVSIRDFFLNQSASALFCQNKWCSCSCT